MLRKRLAYGCTVVVAAQPSIGKSRTERWIQSEDADVQWIMKQNLKMNRVLRMDKAWVVAQLQALG